jgi:hypothetical protein
MAGNCRFGPCCELMQNHRLAIHLFSFRISRRRSRRRSGRLSRNPRNGHTVGDATRRETSHIWHPSRRRARDAARPDRSASASSLRRDLAANLLQIQRRAIVYLFIVATDGDQGRSLKIRGRPRGTGKKPTRDLSRSDGVCGHGTPDGGLGNRGKSHWAEVASPMSRLAAARPGVGQGHGTAEAR